MRIRLQVIIARAGITSRRKAEELIRNGKVTVNGKVVRELGSKADPDKDHVKVRNRLIPTHKPHVYLLFHKPRGVVTTLNDPQGRPTIKDFLKGIKTRVYPAGRLDYDSEGLLFLTNDGQMAHDLMHPSLETPRTYHVKVAGALSDAELIRLRKGVPLSNGKTASCRVEKRRRTASNSWLEITLYEGQKRQIRRMMDKLGHSVLKLKRVRLATLEITGIEAGRYRYLYPEELRALKAYLTRRRSALSRKTVGPLIPAVRHG